MTVDIAPVVFTVGFGVVVNILIFAFGYGKLSQKVNGSQESLLALEKRMNERLKKAEAAPEYHMLPECISLFTAIKSDLGEVKGMIGTLVRTQNKT